MAQSGKPKLSSRAKQFLAETRTFGEMGVLAILGGQQDVVDDARLAVTFEARKVLLTDLANLRDDAALPWFWRRRERDGIFPELSRDVMELRDELRSVWTCAPRASFKAQAVLNNWLLWQPSEDMIPAYQLLGFRGTPLNYAAFTCSIAARRLVPNYMSLRSLLIQGVFEHWGHFKFCSNNDCVSPYFIAKRKDQTVCDSEACKAEKQRAHALKWWTENRAKKKVPANAAKGRLKHVTRKTR